MAAYWQEQLHYHVTKSQLSAWNSTLYGMNTRFSWGKGTLRWFLESSWLATQVIMTLVWYNPDPTCLAPQKCGVHFIGRQNSQLIRSHMAMTTLHTSSIPPWGMLQFSARRMGTNSTSPVIPNQSFIPILASLYNFIHPDLEHNTSIKPIVTPGHQSLDAKTQNYMTTNDPYSNSTSWDQHNHKSFLIFACNTNEVVCTLPVYLHNLVATWLNRLPITPEHSSSS